MPDTRPLAIRVLIEVAECSQGDVAEHLGISNSLLGRFLSGKRPMSEERRRKVAEFLVSRILDKVGT